MKTLLPFLLMAVFSAHAQTPITGYGGITISDDYADGYNTRHYAIVKSAVPLDESATGADIVWNFDLTTIGSVWILNTTPSALELAQYPGTTMVSTIESTIGTATSETKEYSQINGSNTLFVTGLSDQAFDLQLNYLTNNAEIGTFPMAWPNDAISDPVSGTYTYDTYAGTFSGSIVTSTDAYGTMSTTVLEDWTFPVTRLKIVENLNFNYIPLGDVGTFTQVKNYYYREYDLFPYFKSITTTVSIPLLGINETSTTMHHAIPVFLNTTQFNEQNNVVVAPNPVENILTISSDNFSLESLRIVDLNGRNVHEQNNIDENIDVSFLKQGIYIIQIKTDHGIITKKLVKK